MDALTENSDPLLGGFYTVKEAARLLNIDSQQRIYAWLRPGANREPVILRDYQPLENRHELSFLDLIELRFIKHFREYHSLQYLRKAAEKARQLFKTRHPFALSDTNFLTDRRKIFVQTTEQEGEDPFELRTGQYQFYDVIEKTIAKGLTFNPLTHLAEEWRPLENEYPNVVVNPRYDYGNPVVGDAHVPTAAIFRSWKAENGNSRRVADWWEITPEAVDEAVKFEIRMAA